MFLKFTSKFIRSIGLLFIFSFAVLSIFASLFVKDLESGSILNNFIQYTIGFENRFYDFRLKKHLDPTWHSKEIALVDIDDQSLHKIGTWPIPREYHAKLIDKLRIYGAKVIALDILYPEKAPEINGISPDDLLIQSFKNFQSQEGKRIFLPWTTGTSIEDSLTEAPLEMLDDALDVRTSSDMNLRQYRIHKYTFPHEKFLEAQIGLANISMAEDYDGLFRQYIVALNIDSIYFGSLALNAYQAYTKKNVPIRIANDGLAYLHSATGERVDINDRGEMKIRFMGNVDTFERIPLWSVLNLPEDDENLIKSFKDKIVFVGSTAMGAHDLRPSPIDHKMPGVVAHMNVTQMFLDNYFFKPSNESIKYSLIILCVGVLLFLGVQTFNNAILDISILTLIISCTYYLDSIYFFKKGYELKLFYCFLCFILCYSWNTFLKFLDANREKKQIKGTFSRYVAPTVVEEMLNNPEKLQKGGVKKDITCLFSDVRDFTTISENLSAADLASSLNYYMSRMTDIIFETKGTLDKYIGDAIVAFWGAPLEIGNHAQYAVEAAVKMIETLPEVNNHLEKLNQPRFDIGIGINSGECSVGNMGSDRIFSYTALGDNMNLGSRIESLCKHYGAKILISEYTLKKLDHNKFKIRPVDKVIVKGRTQSVPIYEVLTKDHAFFTKEDLFKNYLHSYELFQKKHFKEAADKLQKIIELHPEDMPTKRLLELSLHYSNHPEDALEDFDVTKMKEK